MIDKTCEICGTTFKVRAYRAKTARFCGQSCGGKWHLANRKMTNPNMVGNTLRKGLRPSNAFTSEQVRGDKNAKWVEGIVFKCKHCAGDFNVKPWIARQNKPIFCSQECNKKHNVGPNHCGYLGGPKTYRGRSWTKARLVAVERDGGICQACNKDVGVSIPVHHIIPYRNFSSEHEANQIDNLVCLCQSCHMKREHSEANALSRAALQNR